MENLSGDHTLPPQTKKTKHWNLLFIGNHGEIISIRWFKPVAVALLITLIAAVIIAVSLSLLYQRDKTENQQLHDSLIVSREKIQSLRNEMELLMARLVLAESKIDSSTAKEELEPDLEASHEPDAKNFLSETELLEKKTSESTQPEKILHVEIKDFNIFHESNTNTLQIHFIIANANQDSRTVAGYIFVILKPEDTDPERWLIIPSVSLTSDKPSTINRGQYFKIAHFKTVKFKVENQTSPEYYSKATIFVFATAGEKILEKTIPVTVRSEKAVIQPATPAQKEEKRVETVKPIDEKSSPVEPGSETGHNE